MPTVRAEVVQYGGGVTVNGNRLETVAGVADERAITPSGTSAPLYPASGGVLAPCIVRVWAMGGQALVKKDLASNNPDAAAGARVLIDTGGYEVFALGVGECLTAVSASIS